MATRKPASYRRATTTSLPWTRVTPLRRRRRYVSLVTRQFVSLVLFSIVGVCDEVRHEELKNTLLSQTRPVSAGPSLLQSLPQDGSMGPLVR